MSGAEDLNNLDRGAEGGRRNEDSKKNLQSLLRRRYQQSRGSARSHSNDENPSPVQEPVSFRPPAKQKAKTLAPSSRGAQGGNRDANGNIIFENNFDSPPQSDARPKKGQGQNPCTPKSKGQLDSALSTVINEISSDNRKGAKSKKRESRTTVFENNFDDLEPSIDGENQPSSSRSRIAQGSSKAVDDQAEKERQARLQRLRRPRQLPDETQDPLFQLLMRRENKDSDGDEKMERPDHPAAGGTVGASASGSKAMTQDEEDEQFLLQNFMGLGKKKKGVNAKPAMYYNNLMQNLMRGGNNENGGNQSNGQQQDGGGAKDPLTEMMEALEGLGGAGGGAELGGEGAGGPGDDPLAQLLNQLGGMKGGNNDNKGKVDVGGGVGDGAHPLAQLIGGLGAGDMMAQEHQRKGDPMAQMMAMMGGGQRNIGGMDRSQGGGDYIMGGGGGGVSDSMSQMMAAMGGGGGLDPMSQMMAALGGGGGGAGNAMSQMRSALGGGAGGEGGMGLDPMSQMMAALGGEGGAGGGGRAGGSGDPMPQMMAAMGGGGGGGGIDPMSQMMSALGGGGGGGGGGINPMSQMMAAMGGGGGLDPMSQMMAMIGGGQRNVCGMDRSQGGGDHIMGGGGGGVSDPMSQMMAAMGGGGGLDPMSQMMAGLGGGGGRTDNPMSQMMNMMGGGQPPVGAIGQGRGQAQDEDIAIGNASLNDQIQQLLGYESLKALNNKCPKSDGMCTIIIIDTSGSMHGEPMNSVGDFISQFLNGLEEVQFEYGLEENVAIVAAGREVHAVQHLTNDYSVVRRAVDTIYADGPSPLHLGLMIPLSILQIDQQQRRDYIANSNGHHICPRVIFITDGHPTNQEDIPGQNRPANERESQTLQTICVEMFQTVRERTLCELYAIPVGDANEAFLQNLSESTGGCIQRIADAKQMSRVYLHHHIVGSLMGSGHDLTKREVVAKVVQQCMACSNDSDVDSVMRILSHGEPDLQKRDQELNSAMQGGRGSGGGAHKGSRGCQGGGVGQIGGRGIPPMMGGGGGMEMIQSMIESIGGGANRQEGDLDDIGNVIGRGQQGARRGGGGNMASMMRSVDEGIGGGAQRQQDVQDEIVRIGQGRQDGRGGHEKLLPQLGGGLGKGDRQRGAAEGMKHGLIDDEGHHGEKENQNEAEAEGNSRINVNDAMPLTQEEMKQLLSEGENEDVEFLTGENPSFNPYTLELLMGEKNTRKSRKRSKTFANGKKAETDEEKHQLRLERVMNAETMGINEPDTSSDEDTDEDEEISKSPDAAEQDINRKLRELLRKKAEKKKSGNAESSIGQARKVGSQSSREQKEYRQSIGDTGVIVVPNLGFRQGKGGLLKENAGSGADIGGPKLKRTVKHNLPEDTPATMNKKSERSRSPMQSQSDSSIIYQRPGSADNEGGASGFSPIPYRNNPNPLAMAAPQATVSSLDGFGLINVDVEDDVEPSASIRTKQQKKTDRSMPEQPQASSRRHHGQNRDLRELLLQRQKRNSRQTHQTNSRTESKQADSESDN